MSMMINDLQNFARFANNNAVDSNVEMTKNGGFALATKSASAFSRFFGLTENSRAAIENNNRVREAFVNALKSQFNVKDFSELPTAVKNALVGSHAKTAEGDFGFDAQGHVTSGKPLTARRISAVLDAVREIHAQSNAAIASTKLSPQFVESRKAALKPFIDKLYDKMTTTQDGFDVPLWGKDYHKNVKDTLNSKITNMFANIGNGKNHSLEEVTGKIKMIIGGSLGHMNRYWLNDYTTVNNTPSAGINGRERFLDKLVNELVSEFNAANPDLKLDNKFPLGMFKKLDLPGIKLNINNDTVAKELANRLDFDLLLDPKGLPTSLEKHVSSGTYHGHRDDNMYGTFVSSSDGLLSTEGGVLTPIPDQFKKDFCRSSGFKLPGKEVVSYMDDKNLEKATDDITEAVTKGRFKKFKDLQGEDLQLVRFAMAVMSQSSISMSASFASHIPFKQDEYGYTGSFGVNTQKSTISYEMQFEDGGITFVGHCHQPVTSVSCNDNDYPMNQNKSFVNVDVKIHYTPDQLDKIAKTDMMPMSEVERMDLVTASSREFTFNINVEE